MLRTSEPAADRPSTDAAPRWRTGVLWCLALVIMALLIALVEVPHSGPKWPDAPRYANGAAMMHDWYRSGQWFSPIEFAKASYTQYPGFSIPYHPPGYPGMMAAWFLVTGVSYFSARAFIAICFGALCCLFYVFLRQQRAPQWAAMLGSLLLLTTPELAYWSKSTMSETPATLFILAASMAFIRWVDTDNPVWCWAAFALAEMAFFSRVVTAAVLPGWFLWLALRRDFRRFLSPHLVIPAALYLGINLLWIRFVGGYAYLELHSVAYADVPMLSFRNVFYYPAAMPFMLGWGALIAMVLSAWFLIRDTFDGRGRANGNLRFGWFCACWLAGYYLFFFLRVSLEQRYFTLAVPAMIGLAAYLLMRHNNRLAYRASVVGLIGIAVAGNALAVARQPRGLVGYQDVAEHLATLEEPGNIFMACWMDQDLIFRYRGLDHEFERDMIRSDRTLAIRLSAYTGVPTEVLARDMADVIEVVKLGRIRYLLTVPSSQPAHATIPPDFRLAHRAASSMPEHFELLGRHRLLVDYGSPTPQDVFIWRYRGELADGPSQLPVIIPTADLKLKANGAESGDESHGNATDPGQADDRSEAAQPDRADAAPRDE